MVGFLRWWVLGYFTPLRGGKPMEGLSPFRRYLNLVAAVPSLLFVVL